MDNLPPDYENLVPSEKDWDKEEEKLERRANEDRIDDTVI